MQKLNNNKVKGKIEFKDVVFQYDDNDKPTINGFSAIAKPGQKIAIVGPTGAGKTTIVNLLMKFYDINNGQILIDGNEGSIQSRNYIQTKKNDDIDVDKSGMIIDLDRGSINAYGEGTSASVTIDPTPASSSKPIFEVKSSQGKELLFVGDKNYYLQSDDKPVYDFAKAFG